MKADSDEARDWEEEFERQTGKRIVDGQLVLPGDPERFCYDVIALFRTVHGRLPAQLRVSEDVPRQILLAHIGARRFQSHPTWIGTLEICGIPAEVDASLSPCTVIAK